MSETIISFTTIEFPNPELLENTLDIFHMEMELIAKKLKPKKLVLSHIFSNNDHAL